MILLDTSGLLSALFPDQRRHQECAGALRNARPPLLLSPFILAKMDDLIGKMAGVSIELEFLAEVARQAYGLVPFTATDVEEARGVIESYSGLDVGLARPSSFCRDGTAFGMCSHWMSAHFRPLRGVAGRPFRLYPLDSR